MRALSRLSVVVAVGFGSLPALAAASSDPLLADQWPLSDPAAIGAREAWTQTRGESSLVAVIDSGIQLDHPELAPNLWINPDEIAGNGIDDDANGYLDDVHGANIASGAGDVQDLHGHGTHIAGVVAARAGNASGGSGVAPLARIMTVKLFDGRGGAGAGDLAEAIRYAAGEGARIINVSLNGDATTPELDEAIAYAGLRGATIVVSAGNDSRNLDQNPSYPASSRDPAVLTVTSSDREGQLMSAANRSVSAVDLAAPGEEILSTAPRSGYQHRSGTSMAAPHVAGALALLAAARPDFSQADLRAALLRSCVRPRSFARAVAHGRLDVGAAMHRVLPGRLWRSSAPPRKHASRGR